MPGLALIGLLCGYAGWQMLFFAITLAQHAWWAPFCIVVFFALIAFGLAWRSFNLAMQVALGLTTKRLAWRDFKNSIADWLVAARTGFKD